LTSSNGRDYHLTRHKCYLRGQIMNIRKFAVYSGRLDRAFESVGEFCKGHALLLLLVGVPAVWVRVFLAFLGVL
jgi:hypothetical protein